MAEEGDDIFIYMGGEQEVPHDVRRVVIDRSVKIIPAWAFARRGQLVSVKFHDGVERIEMNAFYGCDSLIRLKLLGVREVARDAFIYCTGLTDLVGNKLEIIRKHAFKACQSLQKTKMTSVRVIEDYGFLNCNHLTEVELPDLERIEPNAFYGCSALWRIAIPLKDNMFPIDTTQERYTQFDHCRNLTTVDLVGGIHNIISSLLLQRWTDDMNSMIDRINQVLPNTPASGKTAVIQYCIQTVLRRIEHYRIEHRSLLKEATTLLELALWKANLNEKEDCSIEGRAKKAKIDTAGARINRRITSGANIVIRNVLPFLQLDE
eukprot:scaffold360_cov77-Skeletonema_marinoi.AAC.7